MCGWMDVHYHHTITEWSLLALTHSCCRLKNVWMVQWLVHLEQSLFRWQTGTELDWAFFSSLLLMMALDNEAVQYPGRPWPLTVWWRFSLGQRNEKRQEKKRNDSTIERAEGRTGRKDKNKETRAMVLLLLTLLPTPYSLLSTLNSTEFMYSTMTKRQESLN